MEEKHFRDDQTFMLIRFGSKDRLESLQKGCLYMKKLQYFIDLEKNNPTSSGGQGDKFEGQSVMYNPTIEIRNYYTKGLVYRGPVEVSATSFGYEKFPVFCMFMLDSKNLTDKKLEHGKLIRSYQFSKEQADRIANELGEYALMFSDADEFIRRVKSGLKISDVGQYTRGRVRYYRPNDFDYYKDICDNHLNAAYWKREDFAFQQEFRLLIHKEVPDHLRVNIGDISDISQLLKAKELLNSQIDIAFDVRDGDDFHV